MVLVRPGAAWASGTRRAGSRRRWSLTAAVTAFAVALAAYLADVAGHPRGQVLDWYDLNVYNHAGLIARSLPRRLYTWRLRPGIRFTYTPFAALLFAAGSLLPWAVLRWLMTVTCLAALTGTVWLTLGALGWRGRGRATAMLGLAAVGLWTEPVQRALHLGQIEPLLMILVVWDLCQPDRRWHKGAGIGLAAGIKLVPLIFIPYLVLSGRLRQAAVASAAFAGTAVIGFAVLPHASAAWWLTGYFLHAHNVGDVGSLLNQSLLGLLTRMLGGAAAATSVWLGTAVVVAGIGLTAAAVLHRCGLPVAGWVACAQTGLLVSPVSWDHHWVWVVPLLVLLADAAVRARGGARWAYWALAGLVAALFSAWPAHWTGPFAFVPGGLFDCFVGRHSPRLKYHLHGLQLISWNLFVLAGLLILAGLAAGAVLAWRRGPGPRPGPGDHLMRRPISVVS
jgi:alpha-1,2-mannosyltransferase